MQLKRLAICLIGFSACAQPQVQVTVCVLNNLNQTLECAKPDGSTLTLPLLDADNYVCMSPDDTKQLFDWVKTRCTK